MDLIQNTELQYNVEGNCPEIIHEQTVNNW